MHFADSIAIIIARIFVNAVLNRRMAADDVIVSVRFVTVDNRFGVGELMHMGLQRFARRIRHDAQADLPTLAPNGSNNRRAIIRVGSAPTSVVRTATRRIKRIRVFLAFFPPHSETSRLFQYAHLPAGYSVEENRHSRVRCAAGSEWSAD